jgi:hypothetical protein
VTPLYVGWVGGGVGGGLVVVLAGSGGRGAGCVVVNGAGSVAGGCVVAAVVAGGTVALARHGSAVRAHRMHRPGL